MSAEAGRLLSLLAIPEVSITYSGIQQLQPMQLSERLEREGVNPHGHILELRGRLLRLFVRRSHPESRVPWYPEDELASSAEASSVGEPQKLTRGSERPYELSLPSGSASGEKNKDAPSSEIEKTVESEEPPKTSTEDEFEYRLNCIKILKLWNLTFSGEKGRAAKEFLDDVKEFQKFTKINDLMLLEMLPCALTGQAKTWYRSSIRLNSWKNFEAAFYQTFIFVPDQQINQRLNLTS